VNKQIRRVAIAVGVLMVALFLNLNFVQVVKGDEYRSNAANRRVILTEYSSPRGQIVVNGKAMAESVTTGDELKYLRKYPGGPTYAPLTGYYSLVYGKSELEDAEDKVLSGSDPRLFGSRVADILTGRNLKGGSVNLTINNAAQQAAFQGLGNRRGAVVALDPSTGAILAAASSPSYDPSALSSHNTEAITQTWQQLLDDKEQPLLNRALNQSYPPGSIFKVVVSAAALKAGKKPSDRIPAPDVLKLPGTASATMHNFNNERCGDGKTDTLDHALTISCNTAFGQLGIDLGQPAVEAEAELFGMNNQARTVPINVARSTMGEIDNDANLAQSCIGQFNVQMTPLQAAMLSAAAANDGQLMKPYLVAQERAPDLSVLKNTTPQKLDQVLDPDQDRQLQSMMENVVIKGTGTAAQIPGLRVGGKTGTADNGPVDAKGNYINSPHAWFTGYALDPTHPIAVAVVLENAGVTGSESAGGTAAAPLAKTVMQAYLADTRGR
jgi:peptidoglycan glycosyltransferase